MCSMWPCGTLAVPANCCINIHEGCVCACAWRGISTKTLQSAVWMVGLMGPSGGVPVGTRLHAQPDYEENIHDSEETKEPQIVTIYVKCNNPAWQITNTITSFFYSADATSTRIFSSFRMSRVKPFIHPSLYRWKGSRISRPISHHGLINELCLKTADS